jgi:hypothetical protein
VRRTIAASEPLGCAPTEIHFWYFSVSSFSAFVVG